MNKKRSNIATIGLTTLALGLSGLGYEGYRMYFSQEGQTQESTQTIEDYNREIVHKGIFVASGLAALIGGMVSWASLTERDGRETNY